MNEPVPSSLEQLMVRWEAAMLETREIIASMHSVAKDSRSSARRHFFVVRTERLAVNAKKRA